MNTTSFGEPDLPDRAIESKREYFLTKILESCGDQVKHIHLHTPVMASARLMWPSKEPGFVPRLPALETLSLHNVEIHAADFTLQLEEHMPRLHTMHLLYSNLHSAGIARFSKHLKEEWGYCGFLLGAGVSCPATSDFFACHVIWLTSRSLAYFPGLEVFYTSYHALT